MAEALGRKEQILEFYDETAGWYDLLYLAQGVKPGGHNQDTVKAFDALFKKHNSKNVLDCACGTGDPILGLFCVQDRPYCIAGSDGSPRMLDACKVNAAAENIPVADMSNGLNLSTLALVQSSWGALPRAFGKNTFDFVMCRGNGFYHLVTHSALVGALQSMVEVTNSGGWVLFDTVKWNLDSLGRACGEDGRELAKWRGWIDLRKNPDIARRLSTGTREGIDKIIFMDVTNYYPDGSAVGGIVQTKSVFVFGERNDQLRQLARLSASGAAFSAEEGKKLLTTAGLKDVHELTSADYPELSRWNVVMGRKE